MLKKPINVKVKDLQGEPVRLVIRPETHGVSQKLRIVQAQTYSSLIKMGVPTRAYMVDLLKREGVWTEQQENELNKLAGLVAILEIELHNQMEIKADEEKQKEVAIKLAATRNIMFDLIRIKSEPLEFVVETIAEEVMYEHFLVESTYFEQSGQKYFTSYDDFKNRRNEDDVIKICAAFFKVLGKDTTSFIYNLPENKWFSERGLLSDKEGLSDDIVEAIEKTGDSVKIEDEKTNVIKSTEQILKDN